MYNPWKRAVLKRKKAWVATLTANEAEHLTERHKRYKRDRHSPVRNMEGPDSDKDFIEGLRASERPATAIFHNEVW